MHTICNIWIPIPGHPWLGEVQRYASLEEACEAAAAEIANRPMYDDRLLTLHCFRYYCGIA